MPGRPSKETPTGAGHSSFELVDAGTVFRALGLGEGSRFLDIACGRGIYTLAAADVVGEAGRLYAVDLWEEGIASLKARAAAEGIRNIEARVADVGVRIPLDDGSVDAALMATVLHDLVQDAKGEAALREAARVLRPGGRFAVVEFKKKEDGHGPPAAVRLTPAEVEGLVLPAGFGKITLLDMGRDTYLLVFIRGEAPRVAGAG
jgi:ubiquinone/menaquinone biosynthesis C-methylase UbiE